MAGIDGMTYDQLIALANNNRDKDGGIRPYVQGTLAMQNPGLEGLTMGARDGVNPDFFLHDPSNKTKRGGGFYLSRGADGSIAKNPYNYDSEWNMLGPLAMATMPMWAPALGIGAGTGASGASGALGSGAAGAGEVAAATGATYSIPTAAELTAFGADVGGMGLTGAGGIGAAGSVAGAGAGAAGYGAAAGGGMLNSLTKFLGSPIAQVGASVLNGVMGNRAANKAADAQTAASEAAIAEQRRQYDQTRTDLAPWRDRGAGAANRMAVMMGLSGTQSDPYYGKGILQAPRYPGNAFNRYMRG